MSYQQDIFSVVSSIIGQNNIIPIQVEMVRFVGDYHTAALLTQLIYWQGKQKDPDRWIYKTYDEWEREIALTKYQASRSAKALEKMGFIETQVKKINLGSGMFGNTAVHYKLNSAFFIDSFCNHLKSARSKETSLPENKELHFQESSNSTSFPIYTKITDKDYDKQPATPQADPESIKPEKTDDTSSSLSEIQLLSVIAKIMAMVPEQFRKPTVEKTVENGLKTHDADYIKLAVLYTIANSTGGTWQKFKAYLGKTIENHWHNGWTPDNDQVNQIDKEAIREKFRWMSDKDLKLLAGDGVNGNRWAIEELKRREQSGSN